jgi:hypothetical protein
MTEYVDKPPAGWFALTVCPQGEQGAPSEQWVGLITNTHPDQAQHDYRAGRVRRDAWLRVPGEYPDQDAAWEALLDLMETRH